MNWIGLQTVIEREIRRFMRVWVQSLMSPWINAVLYIFIFGFVVGSRIDHINGVPYINFVLPGIVMLTLISSSFSQTSFSLYFQRFARHIEEILVAPLSYVEVVFGFVIGGITRGVLAAVGVYIIAILFGAASIVSIPWFLFYALSVAIIFSLLGLLVALWADNFEQLSILNTFVITPLTFLGGIFNSITMLPQELQTIVRFNPFFYFVDGLRYAMVGVREADALTGVFVISGLILFFGLLVWYLFKIGWKIRT